MMHYTVPRAVPGRVPLAGFLAVPCSTAGFFLFIFGVQHPPGDLEVVPPGDGYRAEPEGENLKKGQRASMSGELIITQREARGHRYELVDEGDDRAFGVFACEGLLGKTCHASSGKQRWMFETRRPKIFRKEVRITPSGFSSPTMSFTLDCINNCTVRLENYTVYRLCSVSRFSPDRVWEDICGEEIAGYFMTFGNALVGGSVLLPEGFDANPDCALLVMLGLYLIEQNQYMSRFVGQMPLPPG